MESKEAAGTAVTRTIEFKGLGKFTIRGVTAGEAQRLLERNTDERTGKLNQLDYVFDKISLALEESPGGPHPPVNYLKGLLEGIIERLGEEGRRLSFVDTVEEKNSGTP